MAHPQTRKVVASGYRRCHRDDGIVVISFDDRLVENAVTRYEQHDDKPWSLTDCLSIAVMGERRIVEALTSDHHFEQAGFRILLPDDAPAS